MVLRLNGTNSLLPGANRTSEINIWKVASEQGIAPPLIHVDEHANYLISTYIESSLPPQPQLDDALKDQAFNLLNRCHQLDIEAPGINYADHINQYWEIIEGKAHLANPELLQQRRFMQSLLEKILGSNTPTGLCHHDPVISNFVGTPERLYLIDWEYAAGGLFIMDIAALATEWKIDDSTVIEQSGVELDLLDEAKALYQYLCDLWVAAKA